MQDIPSVGTCWRHRRNETEIRFLFEKENAPGLLTLGSARGYRQLPMSESNDFPELGGNHEPQISTGPRMVFHVALFFVCFLLLYSRRPDAVLNAQFYAEDGARWYRDAYELGWRCLMIPETGYLQTVSRLIALFALLFPFASAPLVMNLFALSLQILPVNLFLSRRFEGIPLFARLSGSLLYLGLPNSIEIHANTTNIQWHLGLICVLIHLGKTAESRFWNAMDVCALALLAFDSPLAFVLLPIAALVWRRERSRTRLVHLAALIPGAMVQGLVLFLSHTHGRESATIGASAARLAGILGGQVFLSSVAGARTLALLFLSGDRHVLFWLQVAAMLLGLGMMLACLRGAPYPVRLFLLFASGVLVLALSHPIAGPDLNFPQWEYLQLPGRSSRYYFFPILAFYVALFSLVSRQTEGPSRVFRYLAIAILLAVPIGVWRDWNYPRYPDLHFNEYAQEFGRAKSGTSFTIPIVPAGWQMQVVKR
jgi:hypothetical protein